MSAVTTASGRFTHLVPVSHASHDFLFALAADAGPTAFPWRNRGETPPPDRFVAELWMAVASHFVVTTRDGAPVGYVAAYDLDVRSGHCHLLACFGSAVPKGRIYAMDAMVVLARHMFREWPLRKIYFERPAFVGGDRPGPERLLELEAVLREHVFRDGTYHDLHVYRLGRDEFAALEERWGTRTGGSL